MEVGNDGSTFRYHMVLLQSRRFHGVWWSPWGPQIWLPFLMKDVCTVASKHHKQNTHVQSVCSFCSLLGRISALNCLMHCSRKKKTVYWSVSCLRTFRSPSMSVCSLLFDSQFRDDGIVSFPSSVFGIIFCASEITAQALARPVVRV